jgi:hypothetical protein
VKLKIQRINVSGVKAWIIILVILAFIIAILIILVKLFLFLIPLLILVAILWYLFKVLNKFKKGRPKK